MASILKESATPSANVTELYYTKTMPCMTSILKESATPSGNVTELYYTCT